MLSSWRYVIVGMVACLVLGTNAQAGVQAIFDEDEYVVQAGQDFQVQVLLDGDDALSGNQALPNGLLSMGFMVTFDGANADVASTDLIVLPSELNSDGLGGPAYKTVGSGFAGASGALGLSATEGYGDSLLATITVANLAPADSTYDLSLGLYRTVGDNFVRYGEFENFDCCVGLGTATVNVVPEPASIGLLVIGSMALLRRKSR